MAKHDRTSLVGLPSVKCLQGAIDGLITGNLGQVVADGETEIGEIMFLFACGKPNAKLLLEIIEDDSSRVIVPDSVQWLPLLRGQSPVRTFTNDTRFAFELMQNKNELSSFELPDGYTWQELDFEELKVAALEVNPNLLRPFWSKRAWSKFGMAFGIKRNGKFVCGASTFAAGKNVVEVEIATHEDYRRKGLAKFASTLLIDKCIEGGKAVSWDAANPGSRDLANKLGFKFSHKYDVIKMG